MGTKFRLNEEGAEAYYYTVKYRNWKSRLGTDDLIVSVYKQHYWVPFLCKITPRELFDQKNFKTLEEWVAAAHQYGEKTIAKLARQDIVRVQTRKMMKEQEYAVLHKLKGN